MNDFHGLAFLIMNEEFSTSESSIQETMTAQPTTKQ